MSGKPTVKYRREMRRLANEISIRVDFPALLAALLEGVSRQKALDAIDHAIAQTKDSIEINERSAALQAASLKERLAALEAARPAAFRGPFRVLRDPGQTGGAS
jgi:hypothetical protein